MTEAAWRTIRCGPCRGIGQVSDYGLFGVDFYGPKECDICGGDGGIYILPGGQAAMYPGGPWVGNGYQEEYKTARPLEVQY